MADSTLVRLNLPSRIQVLDATDVLVGRAATAAGFDADSRRDIQTAVHEALVNAITHGNHQDEARYVALQVSLDADGLEIRVQDEGDGFDPASVPDPLAPENLSKSSGRGVLLMRALMDEVTFRRPAGGGMEVTMRKARPARLTASGGSASLTGFLRHSRSRAARRS